VTVFSSILTLDLTAIKFRDIFLGFAASNHFVFLANILYSVFAIRVNAISKSTFTTTGEDKALRLKKSTFS